MGSYSAHTYSDTDSKISISFKEQKKYPRSPCCHGESAIVFGPIPRGDSHQTGFEPQLKQAEPRVMPEEVEVAAQPGMPSERHPGTKGDQAPAVDH